MSQAGKPSPPNLPHEKDRHLESRDGHLRLAAGGWENDLNSSSTSEASPYSLCEVNTGYACSHRMRNWRNAGMDRPRFTASRQATASGAYATRFWQSPGCGMCFRARRRLSRRERMAGECARVLSGPLVPSLIGATLLGRGSPQPLPRTHAIHSGQPKLPVGRWADRINWSLTTGALRQCQLPAVYVEGELYKTRVASRWTMSRSIIPS